MKKIMLYCLAICFAASCSDDTLKDDVQIENTSQKLLTPQEIDAFIDSEIETNGDMNWSQVPTNVLWSAVVHGGGILSIGFGEKEDLFQINNQKSVDTKASILQEINTTETIAKSSDMLIYEDLFFNQLDLKIENFQTVENLKSNKKMRYLEPSGYQYGVTIQKSTSGCDQSSNSINTADFKTITPGAQQPWNYVIHNIDDAWALSTGRGVTVGVIDTGLSGTQNLMNANFNDGLSTGRSVQRFGTFTDSAFPWVNNPDGNNDKCGHGTSMSSTIAAPRNNDNMPVGVAYNSNLVVYRGTEDVLLNDYHERRGVTDALRALADRRDVKVISMSIGFIYSIGNISDAIKYAYSKGKLIIAAGGTSTSFTNGFGVIFPASMDETVAVTGLKDNGYNRCDVCHSGSKIDFTIVMQRANDANRTVPVLGFNSGERKYVGGSSVATATTAGIAALVWSKNPSWTRDQVLNKLKQSSQFYPNRNSDFGYGNIDALKAVQ